MDPQTRIDDLLFIVTNLNEVLQLENEALEQGRHGQVSELVEQKVKLSRAYEVRVLGMKYADDSYVGVAPVALASLKEQGERLNALIEINERELSIGLETSRRFIEVISDTVKAETPSAGTYGCDGAVGLTGPANRKKTASIAINKEL